MQVQLTLLLDWINGQSITDATTHLEKTYGVTATAKWRNPPFIYVTVDTDKETLDRILQCHFVYGVRKSE